MANPVYSLGVDLGNNKQRMLGILNVARGWDGWRAYVGMGGGNGTVIPLLKGKVRIPPPAGHFIDPPLFQEKKIIDPSLVTRKFSPC